MHQQLAFLMHVHVAHTHAPVDTGKQAMLDTIYVEYMHARAWGHLLFAVKAYQPGTLSVES